MEQALTQLATKNGLVIGVGGQTQAAVYKVAKRFPNVKFTIVGGNAGESAPNVAGYDVKQAEIAYVAGAAAADAVEERCRQLYRGLEIPSIVNSGKEFGSVPKASTRTSNISRAIPAISTMSPKLRKRRSRRSRKAPTFITTSSTSACAAWNRRPRKKARISSAAIRIIAGATRSTPAYSITGVGFQVSYAIDHYIDGTWAAGYKPFGLAMGPQASDLIICNGTPAMKAKVDAIKADILSGKIKVLEG